MMLQKTYFEDELHLAWSSAVHLDFFENLIKLRVRRLPDVYNAPGQT